MSGRPRLARRRACAAVAAALCVAGIAPPAGARIGYSTGSVTHVSVSTVGASANGGAGALGRRHSFPGRLRTQFGSPITPRDDFAPAISPGGRLIAFTTDATNLFPKDGNNTTDVVLRDRDPDGNGRFDSGGVNTRRVSLGGGRAEPNGSSSWPAMTPDGRWVAFTTTASNLDAGDTNGLLDVYVYDRDADGDGVFDEIEPDATRALRASVGPAGQQSASRHGHAFAAAISDDGTQIAYSSWSSGMHPDDDNRCGPADAPEACSDVFVRNRDADGPGGASPDAPGNTTTVLVSRGLDGTSGEGPSGGEPPVYAAKAPSLSADGRFVAFHSEAPDLVEDDENGAVSDVFVYDRDTDEDGVFDEDGATAMSRIPLPPIESPRHPSLERRWRRFNPEISADGSTVAYTAYASVRPRAGTLLAPGVDVDVESHVFVWNRLTGGQAEIGIAGSGVSGGGVAGESRIYSPTLSGDGRFVAFTAAVARSTAYSDDGNLRLDVFVHDRDADGDGVLDEPGSGTATTRISVGRWMGGLSFEPADDDSYGARVSRDGTQVAFISWAGNLQRGRPYQSQQSTARVYVWTRAAGLCVEVACPL